MSLLDPHRARILCTRLSFSAVSPVQHPMQCTMCTLTAAGIAFAMKSSGIAASHPGMLHMRELQKYCHCGMPVTSDGLACMLHALLSERSTAAPKSGAQCTRQGALQHTHARTHARTHTHTPSYTINGICTAGPHQPPGVDGQGQWGVDGRRAHGEVSGQVRRLHEHPPGTCHQ